MYKYSLALFLLILVWKLVDPIPNKAVNGERHQSTDARVYN